MIPGHEHGKVYRKLPLTESHWSFDEFTDMVNKVEHGHKRKSKKKDYQPANDDVEQVVTLLGVDRLTAITMLKAAYHGRL